MLRVRIGYTMFGLSLLAAASCTATPAQVVGGAAGAAATESVSMPAPPSAAGAVPPQNPLQTLAARYAQVAAAHAARAQHAGADAGAAPVATPDGAAGPSDTLNTLELAVSAGTGVQGLLPGASARTVLTHGVNEAENLFFTDDGRLFVSGGEDIDEIEREADGSFTKVDHFEENCLVEGITRSGTYLYGVCTGSSDDGFPAFLIGGELTKDPVFRSIASLDMASIPNGITADPEGHLFITYSLTNQIVRVTLASPLTVERTEVWANDLSLANGIKYVDHALYVTVLDTDLVSRLLRIAVLPDGSAGSPTPLYERPLTVLDDFVPFDDGFIITDYVKGSLIFWDEARGVYAETFPATFYSPTALALGEPPMFTQRQLIVAEKGTLFVRDEVNGDLVSMYQLL